MVTLSTVVVSTTQVLLVRGRLVGIFIYQPRLHPGPPLIVYCTQLSHYFGIFIDNIFSFTRVVLEVEKLLPILVIHQSETFVLD